MSDKQLATIVKNTQGIGTGFAMLLGAGASVSSGVPSAGTLIDRWHEEYHAIKCADGSTINDFISKQRWHKDTSEYSVLFESLYPTASLRRDYIESIVRSATPSWGYANLVGMLESGLIDTIFTTNFDDLIVEACYRFSQQVRPIVSHHDSSAKYIRIRSSRPKIIKLHGDFLFDNIKNTVRELESLEQNTREKLKQIALEYGLIVIGYNGNDRSIMEPLEQMLRQEEYFRNGVYWCTTNPDDISEHVQALGAISTRFRIVKINSFDDFISFLRQKCECKLPSDILDPLGATRRRLESLLRQDQILADSEVIRLDQETLSSQLESMLRQSPDDQLDMDSAVLENDLTRYRIFPFGTLAARSYRARQYDRAIEYAIKHYKAVKMNSEKDELIENSIIYVITFDKNSTINDDTIWNDYFLDSKELFQAKPARTFGICVALIESGRYDLADRILQEGYRMSLTSPSNYPLNYYYINKYQIQRWQGVSLSHEAISVLEDIVKSSNQREEVAAALILLDRFSEARAGIDSLPSDMKSAFMSWPIYQLLVRNNGQNSIQWSDDQE